METRELLLLAMNAGLEAGKAIMEVYREGNFKIMLKEDKSPVTEADHLAHRIIEEQLKFPVIPILSEEGRDIPWSERSKWDRFWLVDPLDGTKEFIQRNGDFTVNIALVTNGRAVLGIVYTPDDDLMYAGSLEDGSYRLTGYSKRNLPGFDAFLEAAEPLPLDIPKENYAVVASRSHINEETRSYIRSLRKAKPGLDIVSRGSALKFCLVAEGAADIYPRFGPTWEWDTGAGQTIAESAGCTVRVHPTNRVLSYNKEELLNPWFVVERN